MIVDIPILKVFLWFPKLLKFSICETFSCKIYFSRKNCIPTPCLHLNFICSSVNNALNYLYCSTQDSTASTAWWPLLAMQASLPKQAVSWCRGGRAGRSIWDNMEDERAVKSANVNHYQPLVPILPLDCVTKTVHIYIISFWKL